MNGLLAWPLKPVSGEPGRNPKLGKLSTGIRPMPMNLILGSCFGAELPSAYVAIAVPAQQSLR